MRAIRPGVIVPWTSRITISSASMFGCVWYSKRRDTPTATRRLSGVPINGTRWRYVSGPLNVTSSGALSGVIVIAGLASVASSIVLVPGIVRTSRARVAAAKALNRTGNARAGVE